MMMAVHSRNAPAGLRHRPRDIITAGCPMRTRRSASGRCKAGAVRTTPVRASVHSTGTRAESQKHTALRDNTKRAFQTARSAVSASIAQDT